MVPLKAVTFDDITKVLRRTIIKYTGILSEHFLNAYSIRGADMEKAISECEVSSFNIKDTFIVFEVKESDDKEYFVVPEEELGINSIISDFHMDLKIYGKYSHMFCQQLLSLFREESVILEVYENGLYLKGITKPTSVNEFINNTLWPRCDLSINVEVRMEMPNAIPVEYTSAESISSEIIIKTE